MGEFIGKSNNSGLGIDPSRFREGAPWRIVADLNEACNLRCSYCHIDALFGKEARNSRTLPTDAVSSLLQDANQMKVFDVTLTGGEVTTMPNLTDYLEVVNDLDFTTVQMITNGTRLTKELALELKGAGLQRVSISMDGLEASNDEARGRGVWKRAWKGIENATSAGLDVNVISVLGKHNIDDWYKLPPLLKEAGVRSQNISFMCRLGRAEAAEEWQGVPEDRVDEIRHRAAGLQEELNDENFFMTINDGVMKEPGWSGEPTPIHAFQDQNPGIEAVVKVNGDVLRNRLYGRDRSIGNIAVSSLPEIWQRDHLQRTQIRNVVGDGNVDSLPNLYYHYANQQRNLGSVALRPEGFSEYSQNGNLRVREEVWGTVEFDRSTFTIANIMPSGSVSE